MLRARSKPKLGKVSILCSLAYQCLASGRLWMINYHAGSVLRMIGTADFSQGKARELVSTVAEPLSIRGINNLDECVSQFEISSGI